MPVFQTRMQICAETPQVFSLEGRFLRWGAKASPRPRNKA